jgi:hypothetical protein
MKRISAAVFALISNTNAVSLTQKAAPDVFGPNGNDY